MIPDPFSTLGLASNVVQFVDFSSKLLSEAHGLYQSTTGSSVENGELETISVELNRLCDRLQSNPQAGYSSQDEDAIRKLAFACKEVASELLGTVQQLKVKNPHRKWQSFRQALRAVWKKEKIAALEGRLDSFRKQLNVQLVATLSGQQSGVLSILRDLVRQNQLMDINRSNQLEQLSRTVESMSQIQSNVILEDDLARIGAKLASIASTGSEIATEQKILDTLRFKSMKIRHSDIAQAHANTFNWIFESSDVLQSRSLPAVRYVEWLRQPPSQAGIYWIAGKAGSGKSTLMKFLCTHKRTETALQEWAGTRKLVTASFFFWNSGTPMQKSLKGLLRSLLFEVLRKCPDLIPSACLERWTSPYQNTWSWSELLETFEKLTSLGFESTNFCFFIDGLDEYDGNHREMVRILQGFASSNIKLCVSSRPWEAFRDAFGGDDRKLYLQDLTRDDIELYVRNKLEENEHFVQARSEDVRYQDFVVEIVDKAQGVFLWVFLVVRSLLDGLTNADTIPILQARLRRLPTDLERFFRHMLDSVEDVYQEQMAQTFQVALTATAPLFLLIYSFLDEEDPRFALNLKVRSYDDACIVSKQDRMRKRLDARTKGLMEVSSDNAEWEEPFFKYRGDFLHRTVRDFLQTKDMQVLLASRTSLNFNANVALVQAFLAAIKTAPQAEPWASRANFFELVEDLMRHAGQAETETGTAQRELLKELGRAFQILCKVKRLSGTLSMSNLIGRDVLLPVESVLALAVERGLCLFVAQKLDTDPTLLTRSGRPLLDHALRPSWVNHTESVDLESMVRLLLERGAKPNMSFGGATVWGKFLLELKSMGNLQRKEFKMPMSDYLQQLIDLLLNHKADPSVKYFGVSLWCYFIVPFAHESTTADQARLHVAEMFLRHGANPNDAYGDTTVWKAFLGGLWTASNTWSLRCEPIHVQRLKLLLSYGAETDASVLVKRDGNLTYLGVSELVQHVFPAADFGNLLRQRQIPQKQKKGGTVFRKWLGGKAKPEKG